MQAPTPPNHVPSSLPEIALSELPEATKDFILAHSAAGKSVAEVIVAVLDQAALDAGYEPSSPEKAA